MPGATASKSKSAHGVESRCHLFVRSQAREGQPWRTLSASGSSGARTRRRAGRPRMPPGLTRSTKPGVVDDLAATIARRYPGMRGYTRRNLFRMRQLYEAYRGQKKVSPLVTQLPWTHHLTFSAIRRCSRRKRFCAASTEPVARPARPRPPSKRGRAPAGDRAGAAGDWYALHEPAYGSSCRGYGD
jgi:hypothetical protein